MLRARLIVALLLASAIWPIALSRVSAREVDPDLPILFTADEVSYDRENGIVRAEGNVEASYGDRTLLADQLIYDEPRNVLTVEGNISLIEPTGEVLFADHMELAGNLESGVIANIRALLSDGARFAANGASRTNGNRTEMRRAVYSPCFLCESNPTQPPLWQIKANEIVHDQEDRRIDYRDAWFEIVGVPVLYTPYLSQPDPTVKRKTGFLIPSIGNSSDLGFIFSIPFYWVIDDDKDLTITPIITTDEGPVLSMEYRQALKSGKLNAEGSITVDSQDDVRGNVFSSLEHEFNNTWRMGVDFNRATDSTYLRRYRISNTKSLTSRAYVEGFRGRNYFVANAYAFQNLDTNQTVEEPVVLPLIDYNMVTEPDSLGGRWSLNLNAEVVSREDGPDSQRLSARTNWQVPLQDGLGSIYTVTAALWADGYQVENQPIPNEPSDFSGLTGRIFPQASLQWRYPLVREGEQFDQVIQPITEVIFAPNGANPDEIPNEDSQDVELDLTNLFGLNRVPGIDRVASGSRINYGLEWQLLNHSGGNAGVFVGQVYRFSQASLYSAGTGLQGNLSNLLAGVRVNFSPWFNMRYSMAYDVEQGQFQRNQLLFGGGVDALRLSGSYVYFRDDPNSEFPTREELQLALNSRMTRYWSGRVFGTEDLAEGGGLLRLGAGLTYEDECLVLDTSWTRENFEDEDIQPSDTFFVRLALKTLGDVGFGF